MPLNVILMIKYKYIAKDRFVSNISHYENRKYRLAHLVIRQNDDRHKQGLEVIKPEKKLLQI